MDDAMRGQLVALLQAHAADGNTALVVTHDGALAQLAADRCLILADGAPR
jgi:ABC-type polar amino acid transport system ATPase subunit